MGELRAAVSTLCVGTAVVASMKGSPWESCGLRVCRWRDVDHLTFARLNEGQPLGELRAVPSMFAAHTWAWTPQ